MKLIDILVEEIPKRGGWDAKWHQCAQDGNGEVCFFTDGEINFRRSFDAWSIPSHGVARHDGKARLGLLLADDYQETIITREQYESALAAKNDGWIDWGGGECPVPCGTMVDVKHRYGAVSENQQAWPKGHKEGDVIVNPLSNAGQAFWRHENSVMDIIAYRLHQPQEAAQPKADEEDDLNECIGQATAPLWNGEGLPPVGCECEYSLNGGKTWWKCKIDYIVGTQGVVMLCDTFEGVQYVQFSSYSDALKFRPTRSEAEQKRDAAKNAIAELCRSSASNGHSADLIYDAIAAGKIPGLRLED